MGSELRKTGISVVGDLPWGAHFCYFYQTKQDLLDVLIPYFKTGLENNEFCLWVISDSELITMEEAKSTLRNALPDLDRYLADGSIEIVGHTDWFLSGYTFDPHKVAHRFKEKLKEALARDYAGMRINGSPAWLHNQGQNELRRFEGELNKLFPRERTIASCTYPLARIGAHEIFDVVRTHQFAIARRQGEWEVIETPALIQAKAEITRLNKELQLVKEKTPKPRWILSYGVAVLSVAAALFITLWMRMEIGQPSTPILALFLCAVMFSAWFGGVGPGLLAIALALLAIDYYFGAPIYSFGVEMKEMPRLLVFAMLALLVGGLSAAQRTKAASLRRARDVLDGTVQRLKLTNEELRRENAERKRAEEEVKATSEQVRKLSAGLQSAIEKERTRIARELHDELGSALAVLKWGLEEISGLSKALPREEIVRVEEKLATLTTLIDTTFAAVRRISSELRPSVLDEAGLVAAIEWAAKEFEERTGIICRFESSTQNVHLSREQSTGIFRIFQEALTNILRHAGATQVEITMKEEADEFVLTISDNGRGITEGEKSQQQSLGILGMRERAHLVGGDIDIKRIEGSGTVITVLVSILRHDKVLKMTR